MRAFPKATPCRSQPYPTKKHFRAYHRVAQLSLPLCSLCEARCRSAAWTHERSNYQFCRQASVSMRSQTLCCTAFALLCFALSAVQLILYPIRKTIPRQHLSSPTPHPMQPAENSTPNRSIATRQSPPNCASNPPNPSKTLRNSFHTTVPSGKSSAPCIPLACATRVCKPASPAGAAIPRSTIL